MGGGAVFVESLSGSGVSSSCDTTSSKPLKPLKPSKRPLAAAAPRPAKRQTPAEDRGNSKAKLGTTATASMSNNTTATAAAAAVKSVKQPAVPVNSSGSSKGGVDREREQGEGLHGSWAARRLQKEKEAGALSAFAGKRTTFDDSD
jgi:hypothetical protein